MREMTAPEANAYVAQYVMFVEQTAHVTSQRAEANRTFIAINAALLASYGFVWEVDRIAETLLLPLLLLTIAATGIFVTASWRSRLAGYQRLLKKRFDIIMKMENNLPLQPYVEEAELFEGPTTGRTGGFTLGFSMSERRSTWAFSLLHTIVLISVAWLTFAKVQDIPHGVAVCGWFKADNVDPSDDRCAPIERRVDIGN